MEKQEQHRQNIADKRMELQKAQEARQAERTTDGSATTGATRPHDRPVTSSPALKADTGKMQEIKRPVTTDKVHTEPTTPQSFKERPLASGASDKKRPSLHSQHIGRKKVVSQETRQNYQAERTTETNVQQKNQRPEEPEENHHKERTEEKMKLKHIALIGSLFPSLLR